RMVLGGLIAFHLVDPESSHVSRSAPIRVSTPVSGLGSLKGRLLDGDRVCARAVLLILKTPIESTIRRLPDKCQRIATATDLGAPSPLTTTCFLDCWPCKTA